MADIDINNTSVMIVTGQHSIFNNYFIDKIRDKCIKDIGVDISDLISEFGINKNSEDSGADNLDFNTFIQTVGTPNLSGRWYCKEDFKYITAKQLQRLEEYIKKPNKNGVLVVEIRDFKDYVKYLKNNVIANSKDSHLIQLSFPDRRSLIMVVRDIFESRGMKIDIRAAELFVMRMSNSYGDYGSIIDKIQNKSKNKKITYDVVSDALKGYENFVIDDLIDRLVVPFNSNKLVSTRKVYKILKVLMDEYGARVLNNIIKSKIKEYIEFKIAINRGLIPIGIKFSVVEAKSRLWKGNIIDKRGDYIFRRMAETAAKTTLKDWVQMGLILEGVINKYSDESSERVLNMVANRSILPADYILESIK